MKKQNARIEIPINPSQLITLLVDIKAEHEKLGKSSPLSVLDWEQNGPLIEEVAAADTKLDGLNREVEKLSERRKVLVTGALGQFVRSCRDVLTGAFRGELRQMVDFGFSVDDTTRSKKTPDDAAKKAA